MGYWRLALVFLAARVAADPRKVETPSKIIGATAFSRQKIWKNIFFGIFGKKVQNFSFANFVPILGIFGWLRQYFDIWHSNFHDFLPEQPILSSNKFIGDPRAARVVLL